VKECFETEKHASQLTEYTEWILIQNLSLQQNFLELWQQTIFHDRFPDQGCDNSRSSHSLSLAVQDLLVYHLILSPYILTTVLAGLQCILLALFQIWSQERRSILCKLSAGFFSPLSHLDLSRAAVEKVWHAIYQVCSV